ncbi:hypothetical protein [Martelella soudanensis]|uniref:hypothetical protein n=1 Tax=unclassified Martelella TaxID=2629616 RepID=UPI0015E022B8|nr:MULTISPECIES: hypothetical protein [unclassified Martelella]
MKQVRDIATLLGALENGDLNTDISDKMREALGELMELSNNSPNREFKGNLTIKLALAVKDGAVTIDPSFTTKTPERPRRTDFFWLTDDGALSTEHPRQSDMFSGPREVNSN